MTVEFLEERPSFYADHDERLAQAKADLAAQEAAAAESDDALAAAVAERDEYREYRSNFPPTTE